MFGHNSGSFWEQSVALACFFRISNRVARDIEGNETPLTNSMSVSIEDKKKTPRQESDQYWYLDTNVKRSVSLRYDATEGGNVDDDEVREFWDEVWKMSRKRTGER